MEHDLDIEDAVFILIHLFGHTVQWNVSERARQIGLARPGETTWTEEALREVAKGTGGRYYYAPSRQELERVFAELAGAITWRKEKLELSFAACALAVPLLLLGVVFSHRWTQRFP